MRSQRAFTLIELLVVVALIAIVLTLAAPSFYDFILVQRLKSANSQLVTDLQLARSEAVSRNYYLRLVFAEDSGMTCYTLYTLVYGANASSRCDCRLGPGSACPAEAKEVRTVQLPSSASVAMRLPNESDPAFAFDNITGGLVSNPSDFASTPIDQIMIEASIDSSRKLRTTIGRNGRPTVCATSANLGAPLC